MSNKKSKITQKTITLTPEETAIQRLHPLTFIDTAPTGVVDIKETTRTIYFTPKVAIRAEDITEEQAETMLEDDLYERFRLERSIVVYGTPVMYSTEVLEEIFSTFGGVETCIFHPNNDPLSRIAEVTMVDDDAFESIFLNYIQTIPSINSISILQQNNQPMGLEKWNKQYANLRPDFTTLQNQVDAFMMAFDKRSSDEKKAKRRPIIDEDGFTLVVDEHYNQDLEANQKKFKQQQKKLQKRQDFKDKERLDGQLAMYKMHEEQLNKKQRQEAHRNDYADKKIINQLKQQRSFNPL